MRASATSTPARRWRCPACLGVLTAADVPQLPAPAEPILTNEPMWIGQPVLAVAAETETIAQDAIDLIKVDFEELPFTVDPLQSLFPGGPDARSDGNAVDNRLIGPPQLKKVKWTAGDFARSEEGQLPMGEPLVEWSYGDIDAGFAKAALVLDETFVTAGMSHHSMEPRSAMAYWENGKCFVFGSTQSQSFVVPGLGELARHHAERARLCRRDLRRRLRLEGHRVSGDGDPGAHVEEDRPARDAAHHAAPRSTSSVTRARVSRAASAWASTSAAASRPPIFTSCKRTARRRVSPTGLRRARPSRSSISPKRCASAACAS